MGGVLRKRIRQLARGKFEYTKPILSFSQENIDIEVTEATDYSGDFTIKSKNDIPIRGIIYTTNPRMECLTPQFEGTEVKIRYQFHSRGLAEGETQKGEFVIVYNQGEYSLSFCAIISKLYPESSLGKIKNLYDFSNLAKENWNEAFQMFYHKSFSNIIKSKEMKESMIYKGLVSAKPSNQNLEEFLVSIRKKNKILFSTNKTEVSYDKLQESCKEVIELKKDSWGYLEINVTSDVDFLELSKGKILSDDFIGSVYPYEFVISADKLHAGNNYGKLIFSNAYQTIEVAVTVKNSSEEQNNIRHEIAECKAGLVELYEAYRMKRIVTGVWANESVEILNHLHALLPEDEMYLLMKAQVLLINRQRQEAQWILDDFKREWIDRKAPIWGYYLYIMTLMEREPSYVDRLTREIELIFHENPDSVLLFWVLSFLQEEYYKDNSRKLKAIEYWVMRGCTSPYLYIEAYYLIAQDPYLLTKLGKFEIRILRWAIRHQVLSKDISSQIFQIVEMSKGFSDVVYQLLCGAYEVNPKPVHLGVICGYLIRAQQFDKRYHNWYASGIELELRITGLYEAYVLSMDEREIISIPKIIQMYFQYESTLPYRKMAVLYNNIIAAKDTNPELYQKYQRAMGRFAMEQVEQEHMDDNLAVLYTDMLDVGLVNEEIAHALSHIIFTHKLLVFDPKMVRAIIYQRQLKEPQIVPITNKTAFFQLYSREYVIVFEDEKGFRYAQSVEYRLQRLMEPATYMEKCMQLAPDELSYIVSYFETKQNYLTFIEDDKKYFKRVLFAEELSSEYKAEIAPEIIRFYQTLEYDGMIEEYLKQVQMEQMNKTARRYLMELLVENHLYDKAYELIVIYGMDQIGSAAKVALASYMIKQLSYEEDELLLKLAEQAFSAKKYNDTMLEYLVRYYNGPTDLMCQLWSAADMFGIDTFELKERILIQIMYSDRYFIQANDIFEQYYEDGGREQIILAYISSCAQRYFTQDEKMGSFVFEMIEARYCYHLELNDACKLALLKYLSNQTIISDTQFAIEDELLSEYTCRNMYFAFYKNLDHHLVLKYHLYDKIFLEYRTNPRNHVVLHYSRDEDGENFVAEDMIDVYGGIFVKTFVIFFGEAIQYYISEEYGNQLEVTESNRIVSNDVYAEKDESRYNLLNQMIISNTLQDATSLYHNMKQYAGFEQVTKKVFKLL